LRQVASVQDGPSTAKSYVSFGYGKQMTTIKVRNLNIPRLPYPLEKSGSGCNENFGENSKKVEHLKTTIIPNDVHVEITRNYGNGCG
jgi:hypothetical protein